MGLRYDGGDAETGAGMDVGAGLGVADSGTGLAVDVHVRTLPVQRMLPTALLPVTTMSLPIVVITSSECEKRLSRSRPARRQMTNQRHLDTAFVLAGDLPLDEHRQRLA